LFEVALPTERNSAEDRRGQAPYQIDAQRGTFAWLLPNHQLDFGGIAKGFVVDQLLQFVKEQKVTAALFDAGGSSLLAWDSNTAAASWHVTLSALGEGPRELVVGTELADDASRARPWLELQNEALAYSATRFPGTRSGQTVDPRSGTEIPEQRACVIVTQSAAWAEVLSTTALCMGEGEAAKYIKDRGLVASRLGWLADNDVHWYSSHE
jgi:thiamine biosynthesis lipoprotein